METTVFTSLELGCKSLYKEIFSPLKLSYYFFTTLALNNIKLSHSFISSITINIAVIAILSLSGICSTFARSFFDITAEYRTSHATHKETNLTRHETSRI